jgi:LysM repeat protein
MIFSLCARFITWFLCLAALSLCGCTTGYKQAPAPVVAHHHAYTSKFKKPRSAPAQSVPDAPVKASHLDIMPITLRALDAEVALPAADPPSSITLKPSAPSHVMAPMPAVREHRVGPGENIGMVAKRYNVSWRTIAEDNRILAPYYLQEGQVLTLPDHQLYVVKPGDTLLKLARETGVAKEKIIADNKLSPPHLLEMGRALKLPRQSLSSSQAMPKAQAKAAETVAKAQFSWPLKGKVIRGYGATSHGIHNDGINIQAPLGAPIKAAASGEVVYAGDGLKAFGNLIIIKHNSTWLSAYAHQQEIVVIEGTQVSKGQIIGYVGKTGGVTEPQLHFSLRNGKKPVNPERYLKG